MPLLAQGIPTQLPQVPAPWDPTKVVDIAERSQSIWDRNWQSGTVGILFSVFLLVLGWMIFFALARVRDRKDVEKMLVELVKEANASASENAKQIYLFQHMLKEHGEDVKQQGSALAELHRLVEERRPTGKPK